MNHLENFLNKYIGPIANYMAESKFFSSMAEAFMRTSPITIGAAVLMVIGNFPIPAWLELMEKTGMSVHFDAIIGASTNAISLFIVFLFAYIYAKKSGYEPLSAGFISLASFLILIPQKIGVLELLPNPALIGDAAFSELVKPLQPLIEQGIFETQSGFTDFFISGTGIFVALFVASMTGLIYVKLNERNFTIKLPDSVPSNVAESLSPSLIAGVIFIFFFTIRIVLSFTAADNIFFLVFGLIQQPLQGVAATPVAIMLLLTLTNLVWFFGIHPNMVYAILTPLMAGILPEIIKAFQEGTMPLPYLTITILGFAAGNAFGGQGGTYGWVISSFSAKSETYKSLRKLAIVPSIFNINEPLIFGAPIMMNPIFFIPFVFGPVVMGTAVFLTAKILDFTFLNPTAEISWTMPSIFHAFLVGGWKYLVIAIVIIIVNVALWYPFFKISDNELFEEEQAKA